MARLLSLAAALLVTLASSPGRAAPPAGPGPVFFATPMAAQPLAAPPMAGMRPQITPMTAPLSPPPPMPNAPLPNAPMPPRAGPVRADPARADAALCRAAITAAERAAFVPDRLMHAIGVMESGRRDAAGVASPWPWTINVEGVGEVFETKQQAIAAVTAHRARGARSIDVGCMQVNLMHHADAFTSLDDAFDPAANARYAAKFLLKLLDQTGSWPRAVAGYHSLTPDIGDAYAKKVMAIWARPDTGRPDAGRPNAARADAVRTAAAGLPNPAAPASDMPAPSMPGGAPARLLAAPGSAAPAITGRGLDSYRAVPTRLATYGTWRRS